MGGPEMAPHTPQRSERRGKAVALLDTPRAPRNMGGPEKAPHTSKRSERPGKGVALRDTVILRQAPSRMQKNTQAAQKGPDARRRPPAAREAYSPYVERAAKGANEADGPFSAAG